MGACMGNMVHISAYLPTVFAYEGFALGVVIGQMPCLIIYDVYRPVSSPYHAVGAACLVCRGAVMRVAHIYGLLHHKAVVAVKPPLHLRAVKFAMEYLPDFGCDIFGYESAVLQT